MLPHNILFLIHIISYWGTSIYYDNLLLNYPVIYNSIKDSIRNQICVSLPSLYMFCHIYPIEYNNFIVSIACIPILILYADIYFYTVHRICHKKIWNIHKYHHQGKNFAVKALDAHFLEHLFINIVSISIGILFLYHMNIIINIYVLYGWMLLTTINACLTHTEDYNKNGDHLVHHKYLTVNYGVGFYIMDRMFGTYRSGKIK